MYKFLFYYAQGRDTGPAYDYAIVIGAVLEVLALMLQNIAWPAANWFNKIFGSVTGFWLMNRNSAIILEITGICVFALVLAIYSVSIPLSYITKMRIHINKSVRSSL